MNTAATIAILGVLALGAGASAQYAITSSTIDGGGATLTGSTYTLTGAVGQPDASEISIGATYENTGGFWPGAAAAPPPGCLGDLTGDGDTNVLDFSIFAANFGQSAPPFTNGDFDGNGFVNVLDFSIFASDFGCTN